MSDDNERDIGRIFREGKLLDEAARAAVREAIVEHQRLGLPLVVWRDGKTVLIPPDEITLDAPPAR